MLNFIKTNTQRLLHSFTKAAAFLEKIQARWKTHNSGDNDVCVIVIKQISASAKTA